MSDVKILQPASFPLHGMRLIEASAGTGKTYTITALYLRLLLGHGEASVKHKKPLSVSEILVVTFTEAATEELRERIRSRIQQARLAFLRGQDEDPFLQQLVEASEDLKQDAGRLEMAARSMDEAAVFTIHGFCQRMLTQHAFESGSLFETELQADQGPLLREVIQDFWRRTLYPMPADLASAVLDIWPTPGKLLNSIAAQIGQTELQLTPDYRGYDLASQWQAQQQRVSAFKQQWLAGGADLAELIQQSGVDKRSYSKGRVPGWLAKVDHYAHSEQLLPDKALKEVMQRFRQSVLHEKTRKGEVPEHALFRLMDELFEQWLPLQAVLQTLALNELRNQLAKRKEQLRQQGFDDLLTNLDDALASPVGQLLAEQLRSGYPVALIDEFQDTDPLQYRIFSSIYQPDPDCGLFMIGDPKQAIYGFRGADIFTYIHARRAVTDHYTLETNWRSASSMIGAVNALFERHDGPFLYDQDIPFLPVRAAGHADKKPLTCYGKTVAPMVLWQHPEDAIGSTDYRQQFAESCAEQAHQLLLDGQYQIGDAAVTAGDIAILVRDRTEAAAVRRALQKRDLPSVFLSNRDSVFATTEADDLFRILQAVMEPQQDVRVRTALATGIMQRTVAELEQLNHDEDKAEQLVDQFAGYQKLWLRYGVLPMIRRLIADYQIAEMMQQQSDGERRLTDLLHLAELLQQASMALDGLPGLMRWFSEQLLAPNGSSEEQQLRLESDRDRITVITIHKSKGLEFPIVLLPFICSFKAAKSAMFHDDQGSSVWNLANDDEALEKADYERLAEDMRLLYVALTRSVHACYLGIGQLAPGNARKSQLHRSAMGYLLLNGEAPDQLSEKLAQLSASESAISVLAPPQSQIEQSDLWGGVEEVIENKVVQSARQFTGRIQKGWRMSSYSALTRQQSHSRIPLPGLDLEVVDEQEEQVDSEPQKNIFSFPKGARAGTFLHGLFEELDFCSVDSLWLKDFLKEKLELEGYEPDWQPVLTELIDEALAVPLDAFGARLGLLEPADCRVEMEFMMPARGLDCRRVNQIISADPLSSRAGLLEFDQLQGMLKGFIDLTFRFQGRYYVLDYKSNYLGDSLDDYGQQQMEDAMIDHRYDFQYQLYTLALHRLLKQRLPDYSYESHMGGVIYMFLRGVNKLNNGATGIFSCRPDAGLIEQLDSHFAGTPVEGVADV